MGRKQRLSNGRTNQEGSESSMRMLRPRRRSLLLATASVLAVGAAAYSNSLHNGFVFDDFPAS